VLRKFILCRLLLALTLVCITSTATSVAQTEVPAIELSASANLHSLEDRYWQDHLALFPALALAQGDLSAEDQFDDSLTDEWRIRMLGALKRDAVALDKINSTLLTSDDRLSFKILRYQVAQQSDFYHSRSFELARLMPIEQFQGLHLAFATDAAGMGFYPFRTVTDYERALFRAAAYARWTDQVIARLREGVKCHVVLPRLVVERLLPQLRNRMEGAPKDSEFWRPIGQLPDDFSLSDRARFEFSFERVIGDVIQPAYRRLYDYLKNEYLPHARASVGLSEVRDGGDLYRYYVRLHTTTDLTPAQIHEIGLHEVAAISEQLSQVRKELKFLGSETQFFEHVRSAQELHFSASAEVLPAYEQARVRIASQLTYLFGRLPVTPYEVRALPESARTSQGNGYYAPAAADGSRPGILWINVYAPGVQDKFNVMTISLHEGLPGHHLQISLAQERVGLPSFRRFDETTAFAEGWGLYAESLGSDMGLFDDPWQRYGHLNYAMLRANRLVVDTGIHAMGWSVEKSVKWMMGHSSMTYEQATAEVERYVAYPGQALAYKVGELTLLDLRRRAEAQLGARFRLSDFHDALLSQGSLPLAILSEYMKQWILDTSVVEVKQ